MTTAQLQTNAHVLLAPSGKHCVRFSDAGHHQMLMQQFKLADGQWHQYAGGFNWVGIARQRYSDLQAKGYRKP